jgi:scyllo-inositol 2-dehydrogenase (NADP+)
MTDLRAALIGYGLAGATFHAPLISATPGLSVATVVTRDAGRGELALRDNPGVRVLGSTAELWERAADHDLVVVAVSNDAHVELARRAIDEGLPVVVDKPLAPTAAEARSVVEHAEARGVLATVFQNRRWDSDYLTLKRLHEDGGIGEIVRFESRFERWRPRPSHGAWRETAAPRDGGGVLLDLGAHLVDQALRLLGPAQHVYAEVDHRRGLSGDDDAFVALSHPCGAYSHLWMSAVAAAPGPRLRVLGTRGAFVVEEVDGQEDALRAGRRPDDPEPWGVEPPSRWGAIVRGAERDPVPSEPGDWPAFYALLATAIRNGGEPPVDPHDVVLTLEVLDSARRHAADCHTDAKR